MSAKDLLFHMQESTVPGLKTVYWDSLGCEFDYIHLGDLWQSSKIGNKTRALSQWLKSCSSYVIPTSVWLRILLLSKEMEPLLSKSHVHAFWLAKQGSHSLILLGSSFELILFVLLQIWKVFSKLAITRAVNVFQ